MVDADCVMLLTTVILPFATSAAAADDAAAALKLVPVGGSASRVERNLISLMAGGLAAVVVMGVLFLLTMSVWLSSRGLQAQGRHREHQVQSRLHHPFWSFHSSPLGQVVVMPPVPDAHLYLTMHLAVILVCARSSKGWQRHCSLQWTPYVPRWRVK